MTGNPVSPSTAPSTAFWTPLSSADLQAGLLAYFNEDDTFGPERATYVGASEVGDCPHRVAHRKVHPEQHRIEDPASAGRMLGGKKGENLIIQAIRRSPLGKAIRDTGARQAELVVPDAPIRCHPDGTITTLEAPEGVSVATILDPDYKLVEVELSSLEGPGVLECKMLGSSAFTALKRKGLAMGYRDQVQVQMGATGRRWGLLVASTREDPSKYCVFFLRFDPDRWEFLKAKARTIIAGVEAAILADDDSLLPAAERCDYCDYCPLNGTCSAFAVATAEEGASFPEDVAIEVEVLAEEQLELAPAESRLKVVKDRLKELFRAHPVETFVLPSGAKTARAWSAAKENCSLSTLKAEAPDAYAAAVACGAITTSEPSLWVRVSAARAAKR